MSKDQPPLTSEVSTIRELIMFVEGAGGIAKIVVDGKKYFVRKEHTEVEPEEL